MICILMGISGSGKSTIGKLLSQRTQWQFYDGDDFHPPANIAKMSQGIPLNDADRQPWLNRLNKLIENTYVEQKNIIIACSALKSSYRKLLQGNHQDILWVYLHGEYAQIKQRMEQRKGHFMQPQMLHSQLEALETPENALKISIENTPEAIVEQIIEQIQSN